MIRYLSRPEVAAMIGVKPDTLNRYRLPEPDAAIGNRPGWLPETIAAWDADRPSRRRARAREATAPVVEREPDAAELAFPGGADEALAYLARFVR